LDNKVAILLMVAMLLGGFLLGGIMEYREMQQVAFAECQAYVNETCPCLYAYKQEVEYDGWTNTSWSTG